MKAVEFIKIVRHMRSAQKAYFKTRLPSDLLAARQAEQVVDKALADGIAIKPDYDEVDLNRKDK